MTRSRCTVCGKPASYRCKYCGDTLCREHFPPDRHWCVGYGSGSDRYRDNDRNRNYERERAKTKLLVNTDIPRIFSHNYSYLILFLILFSFLLQLLIPGGLITTGIPNSYEKLLWLNPMLLEGRPWTLVTHIFLHSTPEHVLINMLVFFFFAPVLERRVGSAKFLLIFFLSGIFGGLGYCMSSSLYPALGASGAICGVLGALAMLMPRMKVYFIIFPMEMWMMVILFALYDVFMIGAQDWVAHTAHLSGLLFGLLAGWMESKKS